MNILILDKTALFIIYSILLTLCKKFQFINVNLNILKEFLNMNIDWKLFIQILIN